MIPAEQTYGFYKPTVALMGIGCAKEVGPQAKALGAKRVLLSTDAGMVKLGIAGRIRQRLEEAGLEVFVYPGADPNPTDKNVHDGVTVFQANGCDGIVSLGGGNMVARDKMAYAEYLAGMAFNNASLGYVHAMAHQLGGFYDLPHGVCNAILLPEVCTYNLIACPERYADIADALGEDTSGLTDMEAGEKAISAIRRLARDVAIPKDLATLGVKEEDLETMADNAKKDACQLTNPRTATLDQVVRIFKAALVRD